MTWAWRTMLDDVNWGKVPIHPPGCSLAIPLAQPSSSKSGGSEQRKLWMSTKHFFPIYSSLACCKILWHGVSGFTSPLTEGVLQIFIALIHTLLRPGLNPRTLGPMASTLTITPPRWLVYKLTCWPSQNQTVVTVIIMCKGQTFHSKFNTFCSGH
jgi:hypothetical protein